MDLCASESKMHPDVALSNHASVAGHDWTTRVYLHRVHNCCSSRDHVLYRGIEVDVRLLSFN